MNMNNIKIKFISYDMFYNCFNSTKLDLIIFDIKNVTIVSFIFSGINNVVKFIIGKNDKYLEY